MSKITATLNNHKQTNGEREEDRRNYVHEALKGKSLYVASCHSVSGFFVLGEKQGRKDKLEIGVEEGTPSSLVVTSGTLEKYFVESVTLTVTRSVSIVLNQS